MLLSLFYGCKYEQLKGEVSSLKSSLFRWNDTPIYRVAHLILITVFSHVSSSAFLVAKYAPKSDIPGEENSEKMGGRTKEESHFRVGPEFPNTFVFLLVTGENLSNFYFFCMSVWLGVSPFFWHGRTVSVILNMQELLFSTRTTEMFAALFYILFFASPIAFIYLDNKLSKSGLRNALSFVF